MKRLLFCLILATGSLMLATHSDARRTYTFEEIESMKKAGKLTGNERFLMIMSEDSGSLTGGKTERANLAPSQGSAAREEVTEAIAYDKVTTTRYLATMAREYYGNFEFWPYIYEENKAKLGHPDRITPGTMVIVPSLKKYGVNPKNPVDVEKAKQLSREIFSRFGDVY